VAPDLRATDGLRKVFNDHATNRSDRQGDRVRLEDR
jgi:hypothetical protein